MDEFVEALKLLHTRPCTRKDGNELISPSIFETNPDASKETKRGLANVLMVRNLWMDFDKGELQPEELAKLFPMTKLAIFNTYSHSPKNPRFRVVFPFNQQLNPDEYVILYDQLIAKIRDARPDSGHVEA